MNPSRHQAVAELVIGFVPQLWACTKVFSQWPGRDVVVNRDPTAAYIMDVVSSVTSTKWDNKNDASSRGKGLFFDFYGFNAAASAMTAWFWGIRNSDVFKQTLTPQKYMDIMGCSRKARAHS
jgi:hypothetical protein